jgi:hypothetical protein
LIKRRAKENGGTIENAQVIAAHESPRTTKLYDRTVMRLRSMEVLPLRECTHFVLK